MRHLLLSLALMAMLTPAGLMQAHAQDRAADALSYFRTYCLGTGGDLDQAIEALEASSVFGNRSGRDSNGFTAASFVGPNGINASVMIGSRMGTDKCSIILMDVPDPQAQSEALSFDLADAAGAKPMIWDPFGDYGDGGFGYRDAAGIVYIAPLTTGISDDIVHLTLFME